MRKLIEAIRRRLLVLPPSIALSNLSEEIHERFKARKASAPRYVRVWFNTSTDGGFRKTVRPVKRNDSWADTKIVPFIIPPGEGRFEQ